MPLAETIDGSQKALLSGLIQVHHLQGVQANKDDVKGKDNGTQLDVLLNEDDHADDHNGVHDDHHNENEKGQRHQRAQVTVQSSETLYPLQGSVFWSKK